MLKLFLFLSGLLMFAGSTSLWAQPASFQAKLTDPSYTPYPAYQPGLHPFYTYEANLVSFKIPGSGETRIIYGGYRDTDTTSAFSNLSSNGQPAWAKTYRYGKLKFPAFPTLIKTADSSFVACTELYYYLDTSSCAFYKINAETGDPVFAKRLRGTYDMGTPLTVAGGSGDFLIGTGSGPSLFRVSKEGTLTWARKYTVGSNYFFNVKNMLLRADGGYRILALHLSDVSLLVMNIDTMGTVIGTPKTINPAIQVPAKKILDPHMMMAGHSGNNLIYVTSLLASGSGASGHSFLLAALDSNANVLWGKEWSLPDTTAGFTGRALPFEGSVIEGGLVPDGVTIGLTYQSPGSSYHTVMALAGFNATGQLLYSDTLSAAVPALSDGLLSGVADTTAGSIILQSGFLSKVSNTGAAFCSAAPLALIGSNYAFVTYQPQITSVAIAGYLEDLPVTVNNTTLNVMYECQNGTATGVIPLVAKDTPPLVFPNPTNGSIILQREDDARGEFMLMDISGRVVFQQSLPAGNRKVISTLPAALSDGIYYYRLRIEERTQQYGENNTEEISCSQLYFADADFITTDDFQPEVS